jgi:tRNA (guanine-N7-)-methyltransferase
MKTQRPIRSFVIRAGRMTARQSQAHDSLWSQYGIDYKQQQIDFVKAFGRKAPLVVEIGFGMGKSLVEVANNHPELDFLGIEVHPPGVGACMADIADRKLSNVRIIMHDAIEVLSHCIADGAIDQLLILFPDPWPKKKHHKRRLIQTQLINLLKTKIKASGFLQIATDWRPYAEYIDSIMQTQCAFMPVEIPSSSLLGARLTETKFECRGKGLGHEIWDITYQRYH